jgi:hypothetical protein
MQRTRITLKGITAMFTNRMSKEALEGLRDKTRKKPKCAAAPPAQEEAAKKVYRDHKGHAVIPRENLMACLIAAGQFIRLDGKRQLSTKDTSIVPGLLMIDEDYFPILKPGTGDESEWGLAEWKYDMRQGRNPNGEEAVCIVRPRWDEWALTFHCTIDTDELSEDAFRKLFDYAGRRVGLCDYRVIRKGFFGQFVVTRWDRLSVDETEDDKKKKKKAA